MIFGLANPQRFMSVTAPVVRWLVIVTAVLFAVGVWLSFAAPADYQQKESVRIMYVHVPAAWLSLFVYACLGGASFFSLVWRHVLADAAAKAAAPLGAGFAFLALATGSLWGMPMWGTPWEWDARLTSMLILFLFYLGYMALRAAIDDEQKAARAGAILALIGLINVVVVHFSVNWWNTLHQGSSVFRVGGPAVSWPMLWPLIVMALAYTLLFVLLWIVRIRTEVVSRRAAALAVKAAGVA
jgi:heme exporter protein C